MSLSAIPKLLRQKVFLCDQGQCQYCGLVQIGQVARFHVNHVIPRSKNGPTEESNLVLQCPHCSLHKSDNLNWQDPLSGAMVNLFNPLKENWLDHFDLEATGVCRGKTAVGRATIEALSMNDALPLIARSIQIASRLLNPGKSK